MKSIHIKSMAFLCALVFSATLAPAQQEVEFNYNGRVHVSGSPYDGTGYFKFTLISKSPETTLWANDGVTLDGSEPSVSIETEVSHGFFSVDIGDTSIANMAALDPSLFNLEDKIYLRSWFSDGAHGFERMQPDRRVVNPALLGTVAFQATDLYVNPSSGNDANSGLSPSKAKATLQAAWNVIPNTLETTATVHLADGTYHEGALLSGKRVSGFARILIQGNVADPSGVVFEGTDDTGTTSVHKWPIQLIDQRNVTIAGLRSMGATYISGWSGIRVEEGSEAEIVDCILDCTHIYALRQSRITVKRIEAFFGERPTNQHSSHLSSAGVTTILGSHADISDCNIHDVEYGLFISQGSTTLLKRLTIDDCYWGVLTQNLSSAGFDGPISITNCHNGILGSMNATVSGMSHVTFSGNEDNDLVLWTGAQQYP